MTQILDGKAQATKIKEQVKAQIAEITNLDKPTMAVVQVGDDPASTVYIRQKEKACAEVNMNFKKVSLPNDISQQAMLAEIDALNTDPAVHGFMVQQPLPSQLNTDEIVERIDPRKDVDCLHPYNSGLIAENRGVLLPCTPAGIVALLDAYNIDLEGKHCVILGRSRIVGKPLGMLMLNRNATVTYCHSRTKNLSSICQQADVLAVAIGRPKFVTADMIKDNCVLIDVGINRLDDIDSSTGKKLCGDVDYEGCFEKTSYITPVPGGVGPMTVAMLVANGLKAWTSVKCQ
ncbi:MAG: bifunctional methylenetetrahydrofolate dehydrogenase/methenyltetrahydrofolate cyclohydrolase FolD [Defluviitaleaceae bacterium]|nr:bifunctional methylenetetrahydrofolate dehydrogenase/methenyltetrahydrofolate cyclohydrolase FolD [Defluviitaleaceae bacterium]